MKFKEEMEMVGACLEEAEKAGRESGDIRLLHYNGSLHDRGRGEA